MNTTIIPLAGIALPAILVPTILFAKYLSQHRQERHRERMQAIQAGLPQSAPLPGPGTIVAIGVGVPIAAVMGALIAGSAIDFDSSDAMPLLAIIWSFALLLGTMGLVTALVFGVMLHRAHDRGLAESRRDSAKPAYDPDMFEPTGRGF